MFDIIIVGAGSAGSVLADRLSADGTRRVCLIEAGGRDRNPLIHVPLGLALLARTKGMNWAYETEPEPGLKGRRLYWPRGRVLGGSSSINAMIYMRGHPEDYAGWAQTAGPVWGWERARDLFIRLEGNGAKGAPHHGTDGPLSVSDLREVNPMSRAFIAAGVECQFPENDDFNGVSQEGVGLYQVTQANGQRFSAARAFLARAEGRANLDLVTGAEVRHIVFDGRRAVGVALVDCEVRLQAGGEVILCGGAVNSPHLLMRSGVGPGEELRQHGIAVIHDAPEVGGNLADHLDVAVQVETSDRLALGVAPSFLPRAVKAAWRYAVGRQGELTSNVAEAGGFVRSGPEAARPDLQFHFLPALLRDHGRETAFGYGVTLHVCDLLPESRGRIGLSATGGPRIAANYLSAERDVRVLLAGLKIARKVMGAPAMAAHVAREVWPGEGVEDDAALVDWIRGHAETIYHPVGTCRMGTDADSVCDPAGRVRGVEGLRVCDASLMPAIIAGNTNAPVMMMAENVADMMLGRV